MTMRKLINVSCALLLAATTVASEPIIETYAGGGPNNLPATSSNLAYVNSVTVDSSGNVYIACRDNVNRVFKVNTSETLTVYAGNGTRYPGGPVGIPATQAGFRGVNGIAVDSSGNAYFTEDFMRRVYRVDATSGVLSVFAGKCTAGSGGEGGPAVDACLDRGRMYTVVDSYDNVYIVEGYRVLKVDSNTGILTRFAGGNGGGFSGDGGPATQAKLSRACDMAFDSNGNAYIADEGNRRIRKVDTSGVITTFAGNGSSVYGGDGGPATQAGIRPRGVDVDSSGNLFIADIGSRGVRKVDTSGTISTLMSLSSPMDVAVGSSGVVYAAQGGRIGKIDSNGSYTRFAGGAGSTRTRDGHPATDSQIGSVYGLVVDSAGNLLFADSSEHVVRKVSASNGKIYRFAGTGNTGFSGDGGSATNARMRNPRGLAVDDDGNVYITDSGDNRVRKVGTNGIITTVAGNGTRGFSGDGGPATQASLRYPAAAVVDCDGNLFIADTSNHRVRKVDADGNISTVAGNGTRGHGGDGGPATDASLWGPNAVSLDSDGNLYITSGHKVRKVDLQGTITTYAGTGDVGYSGDGGSATMATLTAPSALAADSGGNLYIGMYHRVRRVNSSGTITTVAGGEGVKFGGDGGPATQAEISRYIYGLTLDDDANLYLSDFYNYRIRRVCCLTGPRVGCNEPPVADAGVDLTAIEDETVQFDASGSYDPDGMIISYHWDFGDETTGSGSLITHVYSTAGSYTATLTITDDDDATATASLVVTVQSPSEAIDALSDLVTDYNLQQGISNSLDQKLENANNALDSANADQRQDAINKLQAFINATEAQRGKELTVEQADTLIAEANRIIAVL